MLVGAYRLNVCVTAENLDTFTAEAEEVARQCSSSSLGDRSGRSGGHHGGRQAALWPGKRLAVPWIG